MPGDFALCRQWILSIGRTALFQKARKIRLDEISRRHPGDESFQLLDQRPARARPGLPVMEQTQGRDQYDMFGLVRLELIHNDFQVMHHFD